MTLHGLQRPWPTRDGVSVLTFEPLAFLPLAPARLPAQQEMFDDEGPTPADERPGRGPPRSGRGPPGGRAGERWVDQDDHDPRTDTNDSWGA